MKGNSHLLEKPAFFDLFALKVLQRVCAEVWYLATLLLGSGITCDSLFKLCVIMFNVCDRALNL
eukprot:14488815-Heterocapsa_arctica.AAC.1